MGGVLPRWRTGRTTPDLASAHPRGAAGTLVVVEQEPAQEIARIVVPGGWVVEDEVGWGADLDPSELGVPEGRRAAGGGVPQPRGGIEPMALAEGVETEAQKEFLEVAGCDFAQWILFGRPVPIADGGNVVRELFS